MRDSSKRRALIPKRHARHHRPNPTSNRYVCVHGHFYQPPRENPWLETVEVQESAAPYHDWNDRITAECYAPNGASRITNLQDEIVRIVNNYSRMSFNFGPTLLSWLADFAPRTYRMIQDADRASAAALQRSRLGRRAGLQPHHHAARQRARRPHADPLGHRRLRASLSAASPKACGSLKRPSSRWVLDLMAQEGIKYTILAPSQCARVRQLDDSEVERPRRGRHARPRARSCSNRSCAAAPAIPTPSRRCPSSAIATRARLPLPRPRGCRRTCRRLKKEDAAKAPARPPPSAAPPPPRPSPPTPGHWSDTSKTPSVDPTQPYLVHLDEGRTIAVFFLRRPRFARHRV